MTSQAVKIHDLKTEPDCFEAVVQGRKWFEFRKDDRGFLVGDVLRLKEFSQRAGYSGRQLDVAVTYILPGPAFGVPLGYVVMSIAPIEGQGVVRQMELGGLG